MRRHIIKNLTQGWVGQGKLTIMVIENKTCNRCKGRNGSEEQVPIRLQRDNPA